MNIFCLMQYNTFKSLWPNYTCVCSLVCMAFFLSLYLSLGQKEPQRSWLKKHQKWWTRPVASARWYHRSPIRNHMYWWWFTCDIIQIIIFLFFSKPNLISCCNFIIGEPELEYIDLDLCRQMEWLSSVITWTLCSDIVRASWCFKSPANTTHCSSACTG